MKTPIHLTVTHANSFGQERAMRFAAREALQLAIFLAFSLPLGAWAAADVEVHPLEAPNSPRAGPLCSLPPLVQEPPSTQSQPSAANEAEDGTPQVPAGSTGDAPLLCACLPLDVMVHNTFTT